MDLVFLRLAVALISIVAGICFLSISIFLRQWFVEGGLLHKKYSKEDGRIFYALIGIFFVLGGLAFLFSK